MMAKTIRDLNLCDDFLFHETMKDEKLVVQLLELVLDMPGKIIRVEYIEGEKTLKGSYQGKGVRLDVYVRGTDETVYNIEIQQIKKRAIGKRSRKYQGNIDVELLKKSVDYDKLKPQYIIFICTFDPFDRGLHRYTFGNLCYEDTSLSLGDETTKVFLNSRGTADDVSEELLAFFRYLEHSTAEEAAKSGSAFVMALSDRVEKIKADEEIGGAFMTFEDKIKDIQWEYEDRIAAMEAEKAEREKALSDQLADQERQLAAERLETARRMKADGLPMETILKYVNLTAEEQRILQQNSIGSRR